MRAVCLPGIGLDPAQAIGNDREIAGKALARRIDHKVVEIGLIACALLDGGDEAFEAVRAKLLLKECHLGLDAARQLLLKGRTRAPERNSAQKKHGCPEHNRVKRREAKARRPHKSREAHEANILSRALFPGVPRQSPCRSWTGAG